MDELEKLKIELKFKEVEILSLKRELNRYEEIINYFPGIILILNNSGEIEYINKTGVKILGYSEEKELIGKNWFETCIPKYLEDQLKFVFNKILEGYLETYEIYENPIKTKFGTIKNIIWRNQYIKERDDKIVKVLSYGYEKKHQLSSQEIWEKYEKIFDFLSEAIHIIDRNFKVVYYNNTFREWNRILNLPEDIIGKNIFDVFPFLTIKVKEEYEKVFEKGEILITQEKNIIQEKEIITETRKIPVFERGRVTFVITFIRELTNFLNSKK